MAETAIQSIARSFSRLGWVGFWIQIALGLLPLAMLLYIAFGIATETGLGFGFTDYLAFASLAILGFTAIWSYRYTRLAKRISDPDRRPSWISVARTLWVGLWAGAIGIIVSVLLLLVEVVRLLMLLLKAPQGGVPVIRTEADNRTAWVSTIDVVSLLADLCTLIGELVVIGFTIWLLFRITKSAGYCDPTSASTSEDANSS